MPNPEYNEASGGEMAARNPMAKVRRKFTDVDTYMRELENPCKKELQALTRIIPGVNRNIVEEIKWNAPSFALDVRDRPQRDPANHGLFGA
jgi:hypothetical protein